jgi:hypothetical protein
MLCLAPNDALELPDGTRQRLDLFTQETQLLA